MGKERSLTPLHLACANGQVEVVKQLIKTANLLEERNNKGQTGFHVACAKGKSR